MVVGQGGGGGNFTSCLCPVNNSETVRAVYLVFCSVY